MHLNYFKPVFARKLQLSGIKRYEKTKPRQEFLSLGINHKGKKGLISNFRHNTWLCLGTQSPGSLKFTFRGALCITLCQHNLFSTARSLQSVSSETVPQQLMYKLQPTGASGWAKIGPLLEVIFHSISNFVFPVTLKQYTNSHLMPPTHLQCLSASFPRFLCQWCNCSAFSAREVDTVYAGVSCGDGKTEAQVQTFRAFRLTAAVLQSLFLLLVQIYYVHQLEPIQKNMPVEHKARTKASPWRHAGVIRSGHLWRSNISGSDICCMLLVVVSLVEAVFFFFEQRY